MHMCTFTVPTRHVGLQFLDKGKGLYQFRNPIISLLSLMKI